MSRFISRVGPSGVLLATLLSACSSVEPRAKAVYANGMTADEYGAARRIAEARCDRQTNACSSFSSREQCVEAKLDSTATDARLRHCSNPVDPAQVQSCVSEIKDRQCGTGIARLEACQKSELCPYVSEEGLM